MARLQPTSTQDLVPAGDGATDDPRRPRGDSVEIAHEDLPPLRPRDVGEMLDVALEALRARFATCVLLSFVLLIPEELIASLALGEEDSTVRRIQQVLNFVITIGVTGLITALVTVVVYGYFEGRRVRVREALRAALPRSPALIACNILIAIFAAVGFLFCLAPGFVVLFRMACASAALVVERLGPIKAMSRSSQLVRGSFNRWGGVMGIAWFMLLPLQAVAIGMQMPGSREWLEPSLGLGANAYVALQTLAAAMIGSLASAFIAVTATLFYLDLRVRHEGLDLVMRLERLQRAHAPNAPQAEAFA